MAMNAFARNSYLPGTETLGSAREPLGQRPAAQLAERNRITLQQLPRIRILARRIRRRLPGDVELEDLVQLGVLGLMDALDRFDPSKNTQLSAYATKRVQGAMVDGLRELDWGSRDMRSSAKRLQSAEWTLGQRLQRPPEQAEVAEELGLSLDRFYLLIRKLHRLEILSLDATRSGESLRNGETIHPLRAEFEDPVSQILRWELCALLMRCIAGLPLRMRRVLWLYYFKELTMQQVSAKLGIDHSRVSQIHRAAVLQLRARMRSALSSPHDSASRELHPALTRHKDHGARTAAMAWRHCHGTEHSGTERSWEYSIKSMPLT